MLHLNLFHYHMSISKFYYTSAYTFRQAPGECVSAVNSNKLSSYEFLELLRQTDARAIPPTAHSPQPTVGHEGINTLVQRLRVTRRPSTLSKYMRSFKKKEFLY